MISEVAAEIARLLFTLPVALLLVGMAFVVAEVMIPSGGVLTVLAVGTLAAAVVLAYTEQGPEYGTVLLAVLVVSLPVAVLLALHWWPKTPLGRDMVLQPPTEEEVSPGSPKQHELEKLVGRVGRAETRMLPGGMVCVDGLTVSAVAEAGPIEPGQAVRVVRVGTGSVVVRQVTPASDSAEQHAEGGANAAGEADPCDPPESAQ